MTMFQYIIGLCQSEKIDTARSNVVIMFVYCCVKSSNYNSR